MLAVAVVAVLLLLQLSAALPAPLSDVEWRPPPFPLAFLLPALPLLLLLLGIPKHRVLISCLTASTLLRLFAVG